MIITLLPPTKGKASVGGFELLMIASNVRRLIGYVPQILWLMALLQAREPNEYSPEAYDIPQSERVKRIDDSLEFMGLTDAIDKLVKNYSGGMIRRLEIAQSMLHRPKVLFLDEPTIGLDPVGRKAVWDHIQKLCVDYDTTIFLYDALHGRSRQTML